MNENATSMHVTTVETLVYQSKISYINTVKPTLEVPMVKGRFEHGTEGNPKWRLLNIKGGLCHCFSYCVKFIHALKRERERESIKEY